MTDTPQAKLIDSFDRQIRYLRLSVTDRCNLRCTYCMAEDMTFLPKAKVLSLEEMVFISQAFVDLGVEKIRLTGGEPLVRHGVIELAKSLSMIGGLKELVMTTNAVLLKKYARPLHEAGVSRLNISIDSLQPSRFKMLTRFGVLNDVLNGIEEARQTGFEKIKLNVVILKGVNDDEVIDLARFAVDAGLDISFIEEMPLGEITSHQRETTQINSLTIKEQLESAFVLADANFSDPAAGPARYLQIADTNTKVGFISPMSDNFCATCNRVRLTTEGSLLLCLGNEHSLDLRAIVRNHPGDIDYLKKQIIASMERKPERHYFDPKDITITRYMSATGG